MLKLLYRSAEKNSSVKKLLFNILDYFKLASKIKNKVSYKTTKENSFTIC